MLEMYEYLASKIRKGKVKSWQGIFFLFVCFLLIAVQHLTICSDYSNQTGRMYRLSDYYHRPENISNGDKTRS